MGTRGLVARSDGYVGIDRRQTGFIRSYPMVPGSAVSRHRHHRRARACVVAFAARFWPGLELQLANDARGCAGALFLCGGAMRMARWRLTGEAAVGFWAAALVVLGGCWTMLGFLGPDLQPGGARLSDAPVVTVVIVAPVFGLLVAGLCTPPVRARLAAGAAGGRLHRRLHRRAGGGRGRLAGQQRQPGAPAVWTGCGVCDRPRLGGDRGPVPGAGPARPAGRLCAGRPARCT